jgi:hypothetical protein
MSKKKFTQDIADILADDLATLESIEPGAILRPDLVKDHTGSTPGAPGPGIPGDLSASGAHDPNATGHDRSERPPEEEEIPLPLVDPTDVDQPDLFGAPTETEAEVAPDPVPSAPDPAPPAPEPAPPAPEPTPTSRRRSLAGAAVEAVGAISDASDPDAIGVSTNPGARRRQSAGGGSGSRSRPDHGDHGGDQFADAVTVVEVTPPDDGGIQEHALPGDRSLSPPPPEPARRSWNNHPVARWTTYVLVVIALTIIFLVLLIDVFHLG